MENLVSILLQHFGMRVEARIAKLCNLFCEKLNSIGRIAEYDGLVDLQFREKRVQAMDFLLLFHECVVLRNASEGELVHEVDLVRVGHMLILQPCKRNKEPLVAPTLP